MKKLLALALGVVLVAAAVPALAASQVDFKGYYKAYFITDNNYDRVVDKDDRDSDTFFAHRLEIQFDFNATEEVSVHWAFRGPANKRWGNGIGSNYNTATGVGGRESNTLVTRYLYGKIVQDWGTILIGRVPAGTPAYGGGLTTLGYSRNFGTIWSASGIFNPYGPGDAISYTREWDNGFGLNAYYAKDDINAATGLSVKDSGKDRIGIEPYYKWDGGGATLGIIYERDTNQVYQPATVLYNGAGPYVNPFRSANIDKDYSFFLNPAVSQSWGDFSVNFEGKIGWGKTTYKDGLNVNGQYIDSIDKEGLGLYLDLNYNYGPGDVSLASWYVSGSDYDDNGIPKNKDIVGVGDFYPFVVAYNNRALGFGYHSNTLGQGGLYGDGGTYGPLKELGYYNNETIGSSNHWAIAILGHHAFTDDIKFNYGLGYFSLAEADNDDEKDLGFEIDLGLTFQLLDNLSFDTQFGYFFNGDAFRQYNGITSTYEDAKDTYSWVNVLTFSF